MFIDIKFNYFILQGWSKLTKAIDYNIKLMNYHHKLDFKQDLNNIITIILNLDKLKEFLLNNSDYSTIFID
jgi:hypothetical protein